MTDGDVTRPWHMCLRHISENGLTQLSRRGLLDGQSTIVSIVSSGIKDESSSLRVFTTPRELLTTYTLIFGDHPECLLTEVLIIC